MKLPATLARAIFCRRVNRFAAELLLEDAVVTAHIPNSGRMAEILVPGYTAYVAPAGQRAALETLCPAAEGRGLPTTSPDAAGSSASRRRTSYDMVLVEVGDTLVSCDARLPPLLFEEAHCEGRLPSFAGYSILKREPRLEEGRADLLMERDEDRLFVETKSITLVEESVGLFPDAPTERGARHAGALAHLVRERTARAAIVFVVQREDVEEIAPHDSADPAFGRALREAASTGVEVLAYRCTVTRETFRLAAALPVRL